MAWMYSHMMSGRAGGVRVAQATSSATSGYMGATRSLSGTARASTPATSGTTPETSSTKIASPCALSYCTGRDGSKACNQAAAAWSTGALPLSLPIDHTITEGWFLSRCAMRVTRSRIAGPQVGSLVRLRR